MHIKIGAVTQMLFLYLTGYGWGLFSVTFSTPFFYNDNIYNRILSLSYYINQTLLSKYVMHVNKCIIDIKKNAVHTFDVVICS